MLPSASRQPIPQSGDARPPCKECTARLVINARKPRFNIELNVTNASLLLAVKRTSGGARRLSRVRGQTLREARASSLHCSKSLAEQRYIVASLLQGPGEAAVTVPASQFLP